MNSMPQFIRSLATILIGMFGGLMWAAASTGVVLMLSFNYEGWDHADPLSWMIFGGLLVANLIGYSMFCMSEMMNGKRDFKMPPRRIPLFLGLRLLEQILAVLGVSAFSHAAFLLAPGNGVSCAIAAAIGLLLYLAFEFTNRIKRVHSDRWRKELPDAPLPADFS